MYGRWTHAEHWTEVQLGRSTSCLLAHYYSKPWKRILCLFSVKDLRQQGILQIEIACLQLSTCWTRLLPRVDLTLWCGLAWKFNLDWEIIGDTIDQQSHQTKRGSRGLGGIHVRDNGILTMHQLVFAMLVQGGTRKEGYKNKICDVIDFLDTCCSWWNSTRHKFSGLQPDERCLSKLCF